MLIKAYLMGTHTKKTPTNPNAPWACLDKGTVWFRPPNNKLALCIDRLNKTNFRNIREQNVRMRVYFF